MKNKTSSEISEQNRINASVKKMSPLEKSIKNPTSKGFAIAAYCYHICHGEEQSNSHITKRAIRNCANQDCPLHHHRGFQKTS